MQQNLGHVLSLGFWLSDFIRWFFRAVDGTHWIPKMCYKSNLGENWIFVGYFNVTFCLNFTIFFKKFQFFKCRLFFYQNWWKVRRTMTANRKKNHHAWVGPLRGFPRPKTVKIWLKLANFDVFWLLPPVTHYTWQC